MNKLFFGLCAAVLAQTFGISASYAQDTNSVKAPPAQNPAYSADALVTGYILPFTPLAGHGGAVVRLRINGKREANFLIDTGSDGVFIRSGLVKTLGLKTRQAPYAKNNAPLPPGTPTELTTVALSSDSGIDAPQVICFVSDSLTSLGDKAGDVDGVLGADFFQQVSVLFDFAGNQFVLIPKGNLTDAECFSLGVTGGSAAGIPLSPKAGEKMLFTVPVQVGVGKNVATLPLLVNTGSATTVLVDPQNRAQLANQAGVLQVTQTTSGPLTYHVFPTTFFGAGKDAAEAKRNRLAPFECAAAAGAVPAVSVLGLDYLSHFRVLLDYPAKRMYLTPVTNPKNLLYPTPASRQCAQNVLADALIRPTAGGKWTIVSTQKGQYFGKAGVQAGDIIETINGKKVEGLQLFGITSLLRPVEYDTDELQVRRDGKLLLLTLHRK